MNNNPLHKYCDRRMLDAWDELFKLCMERKAWLQLILKQTELKLIPEADMEKINMVEFLNFNEDKLFKVKYLEESTRHDLAASLLLAESELPVELQSKIHWGATSSDIEDFATNLQVNYASLVLESQLKDLIDCLVKFCQEHAATAVLGRTHLQPAEPTTLGYRFAVYLNELYLAFESFIRLEQEDQTNKGMRGAVGTMGDLLEVCPEITAALSFASSFPCGQTYPRQRDLRILHALSDMAATLHKMAMDIRLMQSFKLVWEKKSGGQIGSSAMPSKSNPILSERVCAISRHIVGLTNECWQAAANSFLERTLDDKISQRWYLSESFIAISGAIKTAKAVLSGLQVNVQLCNVEIWDEWKAWIPARKLALLQEDQAAPRSELYKKVEKELEESTSMEEFLAQLVVITPANQEVVKEWLLSTRAAIAITKDVCTSIGEKVKNAHTGVW